MAPHSSPLEWKIPWMEEPSRLQSWGRVHSLSSSLSESVIRLISNCLQVKSAYSATRIASLTQLICAY